MKKTVKAVFRGDMAKAELTQRALARFLGKSAITVNRWCRVRRDGLRPPKYARAFVAAYAVLSKRLRRRLAKRFNTSE